MRFCVCVCVSVCVFVCVIVCVFVCIFGTDWWLPGLQSRGERKGRTRRTPLQYDACIWDELQIAGQGEREREEHEKKRPPTEVETHSRLCRHGGGSSDDLRLHRRSGLQQRKLAVLQVLPAPQHIQRDGRTALETGDTARQPWRCRPGEPLTSTPPSTASRPCISPAP